MSAPKRSRREIARAREKLLRELEHLASLEPGGAPERPIVVDSPVIVDLRAAAQPCPLCEGSLKLEEHAATEIDGNRLRVATLACTSCGVRRKRYFRLGGPTLH